MHAIVTMAGAGKRFRDAGYDVPKYEIRVGGRTLFSWSIESLRSFIDARWRFTFVALAEHRGRNFIERECKALGIERFDILELERLTDGQATTVIAAAPCVVDVHAPIVIYNIDTFVEPATMPLAAMRGDGWVPCFPGRGDAWSFARCDEGLRVLELREKVRISNDATVGLYGFSSFAAYRGTYETYYGDGRNLERGEKYIAPMYNQLIAEGRSVFVHRVPAEAVHPLGTPEEVRAFEARPFTSLRGASPPERPR